MRILLVDDEQDTREQVSIIFREAEGIDIDFASSSKEAIGLFNTRAYNACVLDVSLPDLTGYYLGNLIRESCPNMPIAFLTNYDARFTKENAAAIKAYFWAKYEVFADPFRLVDMVKSIAADVACSGANSIETPSILKQIA